MFAVSPVNNQQQTIKSQQHIQRARQTKCLTTEYTTTTSCQEAGNEFCLLSDFPHINQ